MFLFKTKNEVHAWVASQKKSGKTVGFVPTMGALHKGHLHLLNLAKEQSDCVVLSIFVNPTQFGPNEDFSRYPRTYEADCILAEKAGVQAIFAPLPEEMYQPEQFFNFSIHGLNTHLCGKSRPGHFEGVAQVVNKLFNIIQPDLAFFGRKDIQQCIILKKMVLEFDIPVKIILAETVREEDGLALSSRNRFLNVNERAIAPEFQKELVSLKALILKLNPVQNALNKSIINLKKIGFHIDYIELVDESNLQPVSQITSGKTYILAGAVFLGTTRLIDNIQFSI